MAPVRLQGQGIPGHRFKSAKGTTKNQKWDELYPETKEPSNLKGARARKFK